MTFESIKIFFMDRADGFYHRYNNDKLPSHLPLQKNKNYENALTNHSFRCRMYSFALGENSVYLAFSHS